MSNVSGKAYAMNVVTPMRPRNTWINRFLFMFSRSQPDKLAGLIGLSFIHFARWVIIRREDWPDFGQPQGSAAQRLHAVLLQLQRNLGPVYRRLLGRVAERPRPALVLEHQISPFDPDHRLQELYSRQSGRHRLLLQRHAGRGAAGRQVRAARAAGLAEAGGQRMAGWTPQPSPRRGGGPWCRSRTSWARRATRRSPRTTPPPPTAIASPMSTARGRRAATRAGRRADAQFRRRPLLLHRPLPGQSRAGASPGPQHHLAQPFAARDPGLAAQLQRGGRAGAHQPVRAQPVDPFRAARGDRRSRLQRPRCGRRDPARRSRASTCSRTSRSTICRAPGCSLPPISTRPTRARRRATPGRTSCGPRWSRSCARSSATATVSTGSTDPKPSPPISPRARSTPPCRSTITGSIR